MAEIDKLSSLSSSVLQSDKASKVGQGKDGLNFGEILQDSLNEVNEYQQKSDKAVADIATGEVKDLHQAALAIGKAETSMKLMLEVRNKAISAYKEIQRTQI